MTDKDVVEFYKEVSLTEFLEVMIERFSKDTYEYDHLNYMLIRNNEDEYPETDEYTEDIVEMFDILDIDEETFLKYSK